MVHLPSRVDDNLVHLPSIVDDNLDHLPSRVDDNLVHLPSRVDDNLVHLPSRVDDDLVKFFKVFVQEPMCIKIPSRCNGQGVAGVLFNKYHRDDMVNV